jgi:alkylation response protein AidB-like acyl-CoA dehydrogenase
VPEELGGQGASLREVAVVMEELGRFVAPVPFLGSAVLATTALLGCEVGTEVRSLLDSLGSGAIASLAVSLATVPGSFPDSVRADADGLHGHVRTVADAVPASVFLVPAVGADGPELHAVAADQVTVTRVVSFDLTRPVSDLELAGAASTLIAGPDSAASAVDSALWTGAGLLASEQLGVAEWCLDTTVAYLKERHQFGRPVGSFQALKHRLADVWQDLVLARATARHAADDPSLRSAGIAKSLGSTVAVHAAEEAVQLHGGIGMTWEHPAHLYLKRAKADAIALGTAGRHRQLLAPLVDLPA